MHSRRRFADPMPFSPQYLFAAFKPFTYEGVDYKNGDPFPIEGATRPADSLLEKLYRQKRITVLAPPQEGLKPGYVQEANEAADAEAARQQDDPLAGADDETRSAIENRTTVPQDEHVHEPSAAEAAAADAAATGDTESAEDAPAPTEADGGGADSAQGDAETETPAEDAADAQQNGTQPAGSADGVDQPAGAGGGGESAAVADAAAAGADARQPVGALKRVHDGFGKHHVEAENGVIVAQELTKAEADALVAKGL